jgi:hypothetical protein
VQKKLVLLGLGSMIQLFTTARWRATRDIKWDGLVVCFGLDAINETQSAPFQPMIARGEHDAKLV